MESITSTNANANENISINTVTTFEIRNHSGPMKASAFLKRSEIVLHHCYYVRQW